MVASSEMTIRATPDSTPSGSSTLLRNHGLHEQKRVHSEIRLEEPFHSSLVPYPLKAPEKTSVRSVLPMEGSPQLSVERVSGGSCRLLSISKKSVSPVSSKMRMMSDVLTRSRTCPPVSSSLALWFRRTRMPLESMNGTLRKSTTTIPLARASSVSNSGAVVDRSRR